MALGSLDRLGASPDNRLVETCFKFRLRYLGSLLAAVAIPLLVGCSGVSSGSQQNQPSGQATLTVSPTSLDFGNVVVGTNANQTGTLTAGTSDITVSSAAWNGSGYSVSGITFPVTVSSGQSVDYTVTFAPQAPGSAPGTMSFVSDATNSPTNQTFTGSGAQASQHSVALSWNPSASNVIGYNVYRGVQTGGPYLTKLTSTPQAGTSFTDAAVAAGTTYYYVATAVDSNSTESVYSNEAPAAIP